jgi:hypothetical protein
MTHSTVSSILAVCRCKETRRRNYIIGESLYISMLKYFHNFDLKVIISTHLDKNIFIWSQIFALHGGGGGCTFYGKSCLLLCQILLDPLKVHMHEIFIVCF